MGSYSGIPPSPTFDSATIDGNLTVGGNVNASGDAFAKNTSFNSLTTDGAAVIGSLLQIGGDLDHNGAATGFYGTAPIAKPTGVAVTAAGIHAALVSLGLIAA